MKKILEIINLASSAENFIGDQFSYFSQYGDYEMHLVCSDGPNLEQLVKKHKIKNQIIPLNRTITPWQDLKSLFSIYQYIRKNKIDIIICHQAKATLLGLTAGWLARVPVRIILAHGVLLETMRGLKKSVFVLEERFVIGMATNIICVSEFVKEHLNKYGKAVQEKSVLLGRGSCNGIDTKNKYNPQLVSSEEIESLKSLYHIKNDDYVIGYCGRLVCDKGIMELVEAFVKLKHEFPEKSIKLFIVGDFEERDALPEETSNFIRESDSVILTGRVPYSNIQAYYCLMNVLVLPSHRDGLGLTPLEAQAMNVPAIVTKHTGCRETIVEHETGEYTDLGEDDLCKKLALMMDEEKAIIMGKAGRKFVENTFDTTIVNSNMLNYLNALTSGNN